MEVASSGRPQMVLKSGAPPRGKKFRWPRQNKPNEQACHNSMTSLGNISSISSMPAWLVPLPGGMPLEPVAVTPAKGKRFVVGRNKDCELPLPIQAEEVSR